MSKFQRIHADYLKLGMFVADLDRPWIETPFLLQGFTITDVDQLATLRELCEHVYIDVGLSKIIPDDTKRPHGGAKRTKVVTKLFDNKTLITYEDTFNFEGEIGTAEKIFKDYEAVVNKLYSSVNSEKLLDMPLLSKAITNVVGSVVRNPDACMLLTAMKKKDDYSYSHAMSCSILAASLGRQIGLPPKDLKTLATGALLCDIGKLKIPSKILNKTSPLTEDEWVYIRDHVSKGVEILENTEGVPKEVIDIVAHHHERYNGKGYPNGTPNHSIPPFARIVGLVDCYDAMTSDRTYALGVTPANAISKLYTMRDVDFDAALVEEFIQVVGIYPCGSLVELTDGRVGVVVTEHRRRRMRPRILVLLDGEKRPYLRPVYVNLLEETEDAFGRPLEILSGVDPSTYNIHPEDLSF